MIGWRWIFPTGRPFVQPRFMSEPVCPEAPWHAVVWDDGHWICEDCGVSLERLRLLYGDDE